MKFGNKSRWKYKNNSKNGVMEIKSKRCLIRLSKKKRKNIYIYTHIVATFEKERTKTSQNLSKTRFQKLRRLRNSNRVN